MTKDKTPDPLRAKFATGREEYARLADSGPSAPLCTTGGRMALSDQVSRALEDVTYISVSDAQGRMDDDLFDLLSKEEG